MDGILKVLASIAGVFPTLGDEFTGKELVEYLKDTAPGQIWEDMGLEESEWEVNSVDVADTSAYYEDPTEEDLKRIEKMSITAPPVLVPISGKHYQWYVLDGYHRIRSAMLKNQSKIESIVPRRY